MFDDINKDECLYVLQTDYPDIVERLELFWGEKEFKEYLKVLMLEGDGIEYTDTIASVIFRLSILHDKEFPEYAAQSLPFVCK